MPGIPATAPAHVPERTLDRWWIVSAFLQTDPSGVTRLTYAVALGDEQGPSADPAHRPAQRVIPDLAKAFPDAQGQQLAAQAVAAVEALAQADLAARKAL